MLRINIWLVNNCDVRLGGLRPSWSWYCASHLIPSSHLPVYFLSWIQWIHFKQLSFHTKKKTSWLTMLLVDLPTKLGHKNGINVGVHIPAPLIPSRTIHHHSSEVATWDRYNSSKFPWYIYTGWWFQPLWKILVNGKDYPIYFGK